MKIKTESRRIVKSGFTLQAVAYDADEPDYSKRKAVKASAFVCVKPGNEDEWGFSVVDGEDNKQILIEYTDAIIEVETYEYKGRVEGVTETEIYDAIQAHMSLECSKHLALHLEEEHVAVV